VNGLPLSREREKEKEDSSVRAAKTERARGVSTPNDRKNWENHRKFARKRGKKEKKRPLIPEKEGGQCHGFLRKTPGKKRKSHKAAM